MSADPPTAPPGASVGAAAGIPRRAALRGGAGVSALVVAGMAGLAAPSLVSCANSGSDDPGGTDDPAGLGATVIPLGDVPVGGVAAVTIDRRPAFVARPEPRRVTAFSAVCTHRGCTVVAAGDRLVCPCHGSQFAPLSGEVLRGPANRRLPPIDVHLDHDDVRVGAPSSPAR